MTPLNSMRHNFRMSQPVASFGNATIASEAAMLLAFDRPHAGFG